MHLYKQTEASMKTLALAFILIFNAFIFGCASFPKDDIEIAAEADAKVNFAGYKTYAWLGSAEILNDPEGKWEPFNFDADAEIAFLINGEMRKRGMSESTTSPDMLVAYALGVDTAMMKFKDTADADVRVLENVPSGALVVVMLDPETEFVTWAAVATAEIQNQGPDIARKRLNYAIKEMFKKLPKK